jgi:hypothetical protein
MTFLIASVMVATMISGLFIRMLLPPLYRRKGTWLAIIISLPVTVIFVSLPILSVYGVGKIMGVNRGQFQHTVPFAMLMSAAYLAYMFFRLSRQSKAN